GIEVEAFADYADVADYAQDAVKALVEAGLVNGKGESLAGSDFTTRAEVAVLLKRVLDYIK
ncbi:MAG: S-layer homology domain-containing protein, partial [Oscillospiraceae bacterium]|nr:S-layer homology domain-containing protein [Oscillospiraceae bacterium]